MSESSKKNGLLAVVGIGPGPADLIAPRARLAIEQAEAVAGYRTYIELIAGLLRPEQQVMASAMMQEIDRCRQALALAGSGRNVALICGGDPGIYAMAGLVYELAREGGCGCAIEIIPGIAALNACAALLGAPLMHDFAAISLSDLMTPWPLIERRLQAAAAADFVTVLYNPKSGRRGSQIVRAREIMLEHRPPATPVGVVSAAGRDGESVRLTDLGAMLGEDIGMQTTVIIGNSRTFVFQGKMVTPRGYADKYGLRTPPSEAGTDRL